MVSKIREIRSARVEYLLSQQNLDVVVIDNPIDLYYFTGLELSKGRLVFRKDAATLYVDGRYYAQASQLSFLPVTLTSWKEEDFHFLKNLRVGFDGDYLSYQGYKKLMDLAKEAIPLKSPLAHLRAVKDETEINLLSKAAQWCSEGYDHVLSLLKEGITEKETAAELELFWKKRLADRVSFPPIVAFGENTAYPHYHPSDRKLQKGDAVLIDIGVVVDHYHSDMTRVFFFGHPPPEMVKLYKAVQEAQAKALDCCRPGNPIKKLDSCAREILKKHGYEHFFTHSLGHGIGLETHEFPTIRGDAEGELEQGMVITIEPGVYIPGLGGVRLEDTVVITEEGYTNLTDRPLLYFD